MSWAGFLFWAVPSASATDPEGPIVEHNTPATLEQNKVRFSLFGRSAFGISDRVELSTIAPVDLMLLPNLAAKWRFLDGGPVRMAVQGGVAGGLLPVAAAGAVLLPGGAVGGAGVGVAAGAVQHAELDVGWTSGRWALSVRGGMFALEGEAVVAGVGGGLGGSGAGAVPVGAHASGSIVGLLGGLEVDRRWSTNDAFIEGQVYRSNGAEDAILWADAGWIHRWDHLHTTLGVDRWAYLPDVARAPSEIPVGLMFNASWTWGGKA